MEFYFNVVTMALLIIYKTAFVFAIGIYKYFGGFMDYIDWQKLSAPSKPTHAIIATSTNGSSYLKFVLILFLVEKGKKKLPNIGHCVKFNFTI